MDLNRPSYKAQLECFRKCTTYSRNLDVKRKLYRSPEQKVNGWLDGYVVQALISHGFSSSLVDSVIREWDVQRVIPIGSRLHFRYHKN